MSEHDDLSGYRQELNGILLDVTLLLVHIATMAKLAGLGHVDEMKEVSREVEAELESLIKKVAQFPESAEVPHE